MPYCSACGSKMEDNERFCASCGEQQRREVRVAPDRRPPARKAGRLLLILISLVFITIVAGVILLRPAPAITVPGDFPTIQAAIDAAEDGDVIVVEPGIYRENIDFRGKAITMRSTAPDDPEVVADTVIHGGNNGSVVSFRSGETAESVLSGFTITGGSGTWVTFEVEFEGEREEVEGYFGGGILVMHDSSPTITGNTITENTAKVGGGGIFVAIDSSPTITGNTITENTTEVGGGILVAIDSSPTITGNTITENTTEWEGGGILVMGDSSPAVTGNTIADNTAEWGGAIWVSACSTLGLKTPDDNVYRNNVPDDVYYD